MNGPLQQDFTRPQGTLYAKCAAHLHSAMSVTDPLSQLSGIF